MDQLIQIWARESVEIVFSSMLYLFYAALWRGIVHQKVIYLSGFVACLLAFAMLCQMRRL